MESPFNINAMNTTGANNILGSRQAPDDSNQFLQLLTQQLRNQTPFEPVDSSSFNEQLASYSSMEEQRGLNESMTQLLDYQGILARSQGLSQGSALLGKSVEYVTEDGSTGTEPVTSVFVAETGDVRLRLKSGAEIDMRQVLGITAGEGGSSEGETTTA
ncbi:MAG: flagellar basal-body rod modification protein FlgD [Planctomycetota bacterium]|jgi:flagellar basal-body rod modification protein FlgD